MKIYSFTRPELDYFELECNFTSDELKLFRLRAKASLWLVTESALSEKEFHTIIRLER